MRLGVALYVMYSAVAAAHAQDTTIVFPRAHWEARSPAELHLSPARLDAVAAALGGRGCIVKNGFVVKSWGPQDMRGDWASSAKPVLSTLLLFAVQEGKVSGLDALVADFGWPLTEKDRTMTFRHLGAMTSGYARPEAPGRAWAYNDLAIQLYQKTLFDRVFREPPEECAHAANRLGALELEDRLEFCESNRRMSASVRDFARIAWLWLNRGRWHERQLIRRDLIDDAMRPQVPIDLPVTREAETDDYLEIGTYGGGSDHFSRGGAGIYGFNWWFNDFGGLHRNLRTWPAAPADTFMSLGVRGNCAAIMPGLQLVVVCAEGDWGPNEPGRADGKLNAQLRLISEAGQPTQHAQ
jgi:CubicO group peptidase (beta-lactamase class C family)